MCEGVRGGRGREEGEEERRKGRVRERARRAEGRITLLVVKVTSVG